MSTTTVPLSPVGGAGVTDADPPQDGISQDPAVEVVGDVDELPEGVS